jgi:hypothetical protein
MSFQTFKIFWPEEAKPLTIPELNRAVWAVRTDSEWHVEEIKEQSEECTWTLDDDGIYTTACGDMFQPEAGSRSDNGMKYCYRCGKRITGAK